MDDAHDNDLSRRVIGLAIEVHRQLGPGLLESVYEECLCLELRHANIPHVRQLRYPIRYKGSELEYRYQIDPVIDNCLIIEVKSVDHIMPVYEAQLLTYLRLSGIPLWTAAEFQLPRP